MCDRTCIVCEYMSHSQYTSMKDIFKNKKRCGKKERPVRTSTPVPEQYVTSSPNDLVTDFFYESWKSGLHLSDKTVPKTPSNQCNPQPYATLLPVFYTPQYVYIHTMIVTAYVPTFYVQHVGYRTDGTFGIMPSYWPFCDYCV